ncbi:MAG: flippase-like domain-containing protein [Ardenticatenaceae bacterium]|nr:flippase-like domain-containing protein [Ardenticatenaceae bacterium]
MAWIARTIPLNETWAALRQLRGWQIGGLVLANLLVLLTLNGRWWLLLRGLGYQLPYLTLTGHRLAAFGVSYFTPGPQFGGEPVQVILVERQHGVPRSAALTAVSLDKTLELTVNFAFLLAGVFVILQAGVLGDGVALETAVLALILLLGLPLFFLAATWRGWQPLTQLWHWGRRLPLRRWGDLYDRLGRLILSSEDQAARFCRERPFTLVLALIVSIVSWLAMVAEYWLMLTFLGGPVTAVTTIILLTAARIAFLLPAPGGLGTLEASQLLAFAAVGLNPAIAVSLSLLIRARDVLLGGAGLWWGSRRLQRVQPIVG